MARKKLEANIKVYSVNLAGAMNRSIQTYYPKIFYKLIIVGVCLITLSFKNYGNYENETELCTLLTEMYERDQSIRHSTGEVLFHPFYRVKDSLIKAGGLTNETYLKLTRPKQMEYVKKARTIATQIVKQEATLKNLKHDSLRLELLKIDRQNTKLLISITKKVDWINQGDLYCLEKSINPAIIFRHAPKELWVAVRELIEKEYKEKRMKKKDYDLIDHHLKGRPSYKMR